jgi:hypothetical protein
MTRSVLMDSWGIFLAIPDVDTANQEWNGNEPGMNQE